MKRRQILPGARQVFAELGFERASVDLIASRAGVSKATVYNHFEDKKALFVACASRRRTRCARGCARAWGSRAGDVEQVLQVIGEKVMACVLLSPAVVALYRHVIAEAARFPDIGQMIFDRGPSGHPRRHRAYLERWDRSGRVARSTTRGRRPCSSWRSARAIPRLRSRLGILTYPVDEQVRETVSRAVRTFVRAFRP